MKRKRRKSLKLRSRNHCRGSWTPRLLLITFSPLRLNIVICCWFAVFFSLFFHYAKASLLDLTVVHAHWTCIATQSPRVIEYSAFTTVYVLFQLEPVRRPHKRHSKHRDNFWLWCYLQKRGEGELGRCVHGRRWMSIFVSYVALHSCRSFELDGCQCFCIHTRVFVTLLISSPLTIPQEVGCIPFATSTL